MRALGLALYLAAALSTFAAQWPAPSGTPATAAVSPDLSVAGGPVRAGRMVEARAENARSSGHGTVLRTSSETSTPRPSTEPARTTDLIAAAAAEFGADAGELERVARCESSLDVDAVGAAQEVGLYQWLPLTWAWLGRISGLGYRVRDVADPVAQTRLTAWAFANGYAHLWTCARKGT